MHCASTAGTGSGSWIQCPVESPDQVISVTVDSETSASQGCKEKNTDIPETRNAGADSAWHYDSGNGIITVAGGCAANFSICYSKLIYIFSFRIIPIPDLLTCKVSPN